MIDDLPDAPDPAVDTPKVFSTKAAAMVLALKNMIVQIRAVIAAIGLIAGGSANKIMYRVDLGTTMADPTAGWLRLNNASQNAATAMVIDVISSDNVDYTPLISTFDDSTSPVLGQIRLEKLADASKFLVFNLTAMTLPAGYRQLTLVCVGYSSASPFAQGDMVALSFTRTGDKGQTGAGGVMSGYVQTADQTITSGGALTIAHGLASAPKMVQGFVKCLTAEQGYAVGDVTPALFDYTNARGGAITFDATNLYVRYGANGNPLPLLHKTSGSAATTTPANWAFFIRAFT
jgi:hypothetical protein